MIPRVTVPFVSDGRRVALGFLEFALKTLRTNSSVEHDAVVVSDDEGIRELVERYYGARLILVPGPFVIEGRGSRLYEWLNVGAHAAQTEWLLTPVGDDSYFFPNWELLLECVEPSRGNDTIWSPSIIETGGGNEFRISRDRPSELQITWPKPSIPESEFLKIVTENRVSHGRHREPPNQRHHTHWAHTVQHRDLYRLAGSFIEEPPWPDAHDLHLHDKYTHMGVTKVCVTDAWIGNCKCPVELGR